MQVATGNLLTRGGVMTRADVESHVHKGWTYNLHPKQSGFQIKIWHPTDRAKPVARLTAQTITEGKRKARARIDQEVKRSEVGTTGKRLTVGGVLDHWIERQRLRVERGSLTSSSLAAYTTAYNSLKKKKQFCDLSVEEVTPADCTKSIDQMNLVKAFQSSWNLAVEDELLTRVCPLKKKSIQDVKKSIKGEEGRPMTDIELIEFLRRLNYDLKDENLKFYYRFLLGTGLRRSEGIGLESSHLKATKLHVQSQWKSQRAADNPVVGEGGILEILDTGYVTKLKTDSSERIIPLTAALRRGWREQVERSNSQRFLFAIHSKKSGCDYPIGTARFNDHFRKIRPADDLTLHSLRHTFASGLAEMGASDTMISELLGHSKKSTTSRYISHTDKKKLEFLTAWETHMENLPRV